MWGMKQSWPHVFLRRPAASNMLKLKLANIFLSSQYVEIQARQFILTQAYLWKDFDENVANLLLQAASFAGRTSIRFFLFVLSKLQISTSRP